MSLIPENPITTELLAAWYEKAKQLTKLRAEEMVLRKKIFGGLFPNPVEGTNKTAIGDGGYELSCTYPIERKVDAALLALMTPQLKEAGIRLDDLIKLEPKLAITEYRGLTDEQLKLVDQILEIKPGSPTSMKIAMPAKVAAQQAAAAQLQAAQQPPFA